MNFYPYHNVLFYTAKPHGFVIYRSNGLTNVKSYCARLFKIFNYLLDHKKIYKNI